MKIRKQIIIASGPTKRGEIIDPEGFPLIVEQLKNNYVYVDIEHDPRRPPVGRISDAKHVVLEDGRQAVEATMELFDPGDRPDYIPGGKSLYAREVAKGHLEFHHDENYCDELSQGIIKDICEVINAGAPIYDSKNAVDSLSILSLAGAFVLGSISTGFFNQLGADAYRFFKEHIVCLIQKKGMGNKDNIVSFDFSITYEEKIVLIRILCCNPVGVDIDDVYNDIIPKLDNILVPYFEGMKPLAELVFQKNESSLQMLYGVRRDGFPVKPVNPTILLLTKSGR